VPVPRDIVQSVEYKVTKECTLFSFSVMFPYKGEYRWIILVAMSKMALCNFIHLIPRMTSIPCPLRIIRLVLNTLPDNTSDTF
jgi:hypothetical protein